MHYIVIKVMSIFIFEKIANLELPFGIAMFCLEINAYFAVKFRYENPFTSAQNLRKAVLCCVNIRLRGFWEIWTTFGTQNN